MTPFADESSRCRAAQRSWSGLTVRDRLQPVREFRHLLVEHADPLAAAVRDDFGRDPDEVIATDLLPTAAACKFLLRRAARVLAPRRVGGRPLWLLGCRDAVHHRPHGIVGVIGTWNYPTFLNAVPILHALVAGNGVLWKPSEVAPRTSELLHDLLLRSGVPADLLVRLPSTREAGPQLADADIDFLHFTGSDATGRRLAARLGERLVPSVLELSGVDALIVLPDADATLAARSAWFAATMNAGQTCMATRRAFVHESVMPAFLAALRPLVEGASVAPLATAGQAVQAGRIVAEARDAGCEVVQSKPQDGSNAVPATAVVCDANTAAADLAICREASFAPLLAVVPFADTEHAVSLHNQGTFGLSGAVFTADTAEGRRVAAQLRCGSVVVNDVIVPTAHPGTPFGGWGASGWGVTQGAEGLLAMTRPQVVTVRGGRFRPHLDTFLNRDPAGNDVTRGLLRLTHARSLRERWRGLRQMLGGMRRMGTR